MTTFSVAGILLAYFRNERLMFLDEQIRQTATSVVESKLSELKTYDDDEAEEIISEELGPQRIGKFFIVRNADGDILFETQNISLIEVEIPQDSKWVTVKTSKHFIRALNLSLPRYPTRTLQVGAIVDANFISLAYLSKRSYVAILVILIVIFILTWLLSSSLFAPVGALAQYLNQVTKNLDDQAEVAPVPKSLGSLENKNSRYSQDEFTTLLNAINDMATKLNVSRKFMRSWTFQMAHELKTPLTILNRDFEIISERYKIDKMHIQEVQRSIGKLSQTISSFLDWAELTGRQIPENLFVVNIEDVVVGCANNLNKVFGDRITLHEKENFKVLCNPLHLEQLISNILSNALKYSEGPIALSYQSNTLTIKDEGPGIPQDVLSRMGSPFNTSSSAVSKQKGVGLGLAWIKTICDLYRWGFQFKVEPGTTVEIRFPALESEV